MTFFWPKPCFWVTLTHFGALSRKHLRCALENEKEEIGWILFFGEKEEGRKNVFQPTYAAVAASVLCVKITV